MHILQVKYELCKDYRWETWGSFSSKTLTKFRFFFHWKVRTCQLMRNVGCLASSKGASATPPPQVWEPLTSRKITLPGSWIPMLWQRPSSLQIQHDVTKIVSWLATVHSPAILFSLFWGSTFFPDDQNWDHPLRATSAHWDVAVLSSHRTFQDILQEGHLYTRLTPHI